MYEIYYNSPIGMIQIISDDEYICEINFIENYEGRFKEDNSNNSVIISPNESMSNCIKECINQLDEYFKGSRMVFDLPLRLQGTEFQKQVWKALMSIPYGETVSYKYIAEAIGNPKAVRAVGNANNKNKLPIIIPCHRVIGSNGKMVGYAGGLSIKEWLLVHEKNI